MSIGKHHSAASQTNCWLTPPFIIEALGGADSFDLDPCSIFNSKIPTARAGFSNVFQDGLARPWFGRVWLNPPYSNPEVGQFMERMADHNHGTALLFARTETQMFFDTIWRRASGLLFLEGRLHFHYPDGRRAKANAGAPSVLCAYGADDCDILAAAKLDGQFVPLRLPRSVVMAGLESSWREAVGGWLRKQRGPVKLDDLYRAMADHPKAAKNPNWRAKVRQTLARGAGVRVGEAQWAAA